MDKGASFGPGSSSLRSPEPRGVSAHSGNDPSREAALVAAVREALSHLGTPDGYFPGMGCPATRRLQRAFEAYEPHPKHWRY